MKKLFAMLVTATAIALSPLSIAQSADTPYSEMPAGKYVLDPTHASLTWKVSHLGLSYYTARFTSFDASFDYDPENPTQSALTVSVDPASLETDFVPTEKKNFNKVLIEDAKWFNAGEFPEISFSSTSLDIVDGNSGSLSGDLTFLGVTKPISLDVRLNGAYASHPFTKKAAMGFSATGKLTRSEFGLKTYAPMIGDSIDLIIEVEFFKSDAGAE